MVSFSDSSPRMTQECSICLSTLDNDVVSHEDGGQLHPFHRACINEWLQRPTAQSCPMCNKAVKLPTNDPLILHTLSSSSNILWPLHPFQVLEFNHNENESNSEMPNNWTIDNITDLEL